jgi:hypothetical protein
MRFNPMVQNKGFTSTLLGIDKLYSIGAKCHIYIVHVQVCKYAEKPPNKWGNTIYKYIHLTPPPPLKLRMDPQH